MSVLERMGIGDLADNEILLAAIDKVLFSKIRTRGYCEINHFVGSSRAKNKKAQYKKADIESELNRISSPLAPLFSSKNSYARNADDLRANIQFGLEEISKMKETEVNEFNYFAIVYYVFQTFKEEDRLEILKGICNLWNSDNKEHNIFINEYGLAYDTFKVEVRTISSLAEYEKFITEIKEPDYKLFFRGHGRANYELKPSLFRNSEWLQNEYTMYLEMTTRCPHEFERLNLHIEKLAQMQHNGLPTRLLDITQNPLIALYFACETHDEFLGEVILLKVKRTEIKYPQSDTVALLASLPLFTKEEQQYFYDESYKAGKEVKKYKTKIERLVYEVRMERPGFASKVRPEDIRRALVCIPSRTNRRLENQEGAFILCGLLDEVYGNKMVSTLSELRLTNKDGKKLICIVDKKNILSELDSVGINEARIYPEIDNVADYIKMHIGQL